MTQDTHRVIVPGSERQPLAGAHSLGPVAPDERFEVTVRVRRRTPVAQLVNRGIMADQPPVRRQYLSRQDYAQEHGADPADLQKVEDFARMHGLVPVDRSAPRRSVFLSGTAAQFSAAFGVKIEQVEYDGGSYRGRTGPITVPAELKDIVEGVFGLDDRPAAKPHFQRQAPTAGLQPLTATRTFLPTELARLYQFPAEADGSGQCIGIIELGGGYRGADIKAYFQKLGLPAPKVRTVRVDGGRNHPTNSNSADGEVMLDIEVAAAVAPKATIAVYFAPNTDKGFLDAITHALHDTTHKPSVISISWGNPEKNWTAQAMQSFDEAFQTAAALGVTICCAAGDAGSNDENPDYLDGAKPDGLAHADFPGSSPHVLCCGGTRLVASSHAITSETVWNGDPLRSATGGGISDVFDPPAYQATAELPTSVNPSKRRGRGVPDVAGDADPNTGYQVRVDGEEFGIGGTSAVAPLWAGLIALINQQLGHPVGFLNPLLYGSLRSHGVCRDISSGNNGAYSARKGWDACTGWGSPKGTALLEALKNG